MDLHITLDGGRDLSGQIYRQARAMVLDGRLPPGTRLPPSRELAGQLAVSRNTVGAAYERLAAEGFVTGRAGAGTFVSATIHPVGGSGSAGPAGPDPAGAGEVAPLRARPYWNTVDDPADLSSDRPEFDLRPGTPDVTLFPYEVWRRLLSEQLRRSAVGSGAHGDAAGLPGLREAIARHVGVARSVRASAGDVLVTTGVQQGTDLAIRVLLEPGDRVAFEDPGYSPTRRLFDSAGMRVTGVPVDAEGLVVSRIPDDARLVCVTPSHQFPLGMPMSLPRRLELLAWAERHDAAILEDDYDSEFRFGGRPIEPLQSLDRSGRVIYLGSFSKVMLPTLRLGFVVTPPSLFRPLRAAKYQLDWHTPIAPQAALANFIAEGLLARHIRRMRAVYRERHHHLAAALDRDFRPWLAPVRSAAGLHLSAHAPGLTAEQTFEAARLARAAGVTVLTLSQFALPGGAVPPAPGFLFGYGSVPVTGIDEALRRFRACLPPRG